MVALRCIAAQRALWSALAAAAADPKPIEIDSSLDQGSQPSRGEATGPAAVLADIFGLKQDEDSDFARWAHFALNEVPQQEEKGEERQILFRLSKQLLLNSFILGAEESAVDLAVYGSAHALIAKIDVSADLSTFAPVLRWAHHMEKHSPRASIVAKSLALSALPELTVDRLPLTEKKDSSRGKEEQQKGQAKGQQQQQKKGPAAAGEVSDADRKKAERKELNRQKAAAKAAAKKAAAGTAGDSAGAAALEGIAQLDLRVGKIVECNLHENADSMYVEKIDLGEESGPRVVVSGLVKFVPIEEMRGRLVVCLCNLKPAKLRGVQSSAMVLGASPEDHSAVELLDVPAGAVPGDRVSAEGTELPPSPPGQLNPKKKIWEGLQPKFSTASDGSNPNVQFDGVALVVPGKGPIQAKSLNGARIG